MVMLLLQLTVQDEQLLAINFVSGLEFKAREYAFVSVCACKRTKIFALFLFARIHLQYFFFNTFFKEIANRHTGEHTDNRKTSKESRFKL